MSKAPLSSNLPAFFQSQNNTLIGQLDDFELGGLDDDEGALEDPSVSVEVDGLEGFSNDLNAEVDPFNNISSQSDMSFRSKLDEANMIPDLPPGLSKVPTASSYLSQQNVNISPAMNIHQISQSFPFPSTTHIPPAPVAVAPTNLSQALLQAVRPTTIPNTPPPLMSTPYMPPPPAPIISSPPPPSKQPLSSYYPPKSKMMHASDARFILSRILQPLESQDPFADDFYYIQYNIKKTAEAHEKAAVGMRPPPTNSFHVPLPTWKDTKNRIKNQMVESQRSLAAKTKEWEEKEQVLGHNQRSNISRPKEQLSIVWGDSNTNDPDGTTTDTIYGESGEILTPLFSTRLWTMRRAVQRGYDALNTVTELEHLLRTPIIYNNEEARQEVLAEVDESVKLLSQSLGIRTLQLNSLDPITGVELAIDGALVAALLQTTKGKKLIIRSFALLPPEKRWLLVQPILARILQTEYTTMSAEDHDAEIKLISVVKGFFQQAYLHALSLRGNSVAPSSSFHHTFTLQLLSHFKQTVKSVVVTFLGKNQLRKVLLLELDSGADTKIDENLRLDLFRHLIATGDKLCLVLSNDMTTNKGGMTSASPSIDNEKIDEWKQIKEAFLSMLE